MDTHSNYSISGVAEESKLKGLRAVLCGVPTLHISFFALVISDFGMKTAIYSIIAREQTQYMLGDVERRCVALVSVKRASETSSPLKFLSSHPRSL